MQTVYRCLSLLLTFVLIGGMLLTPSATQAAPTAQESGNDSAGKAYLPMVAVPAQDETSAAPLLPEQYNSESEDAPTLAEGQVQSATCWSYIKFTNSSNYSVKIYWVNYFGSEDLYKTLSAGSSYWQHTFYGHKWRVRDTSGNLLKSVTANSCSSIYVTIYNSDFPQATPTATPALSLIGDRVWDDLNRNGLQDTGEPGISGVRVELWVDSNNNGSHDTLVSTTTTNGSGNYSFTGLNTSKRYVVKFSLPTCYVFTTPNVGHDDAIDSDVTVFSYGGTDLISLATNRNRTDVDAGMYNNCAPTATPTRTPTPAPQFGSIGDFVWNDFNRNGIQDAGEPGASNVTMQLKDCAQNVIRTTTTNGSGAYSFTGLSAGCYIIGLVVPGGFQISPKAQGTNNNLDSDINIGNAMSDGINLGAGQNITNIDAGINQPTVPTATPTNTPAPQLGSIGDRVWNDFNRNGIQEGGEPGVPNISVILRDCAGNPLRTTTTDANGLYLFTGLNAGCYVVRFANVDANLFAFSPGNEGNNDNLDSDITSLDSVTPGIINGNTDPINLGAGQNIDNVDAGLNQPPAPTSTPTPTPTPQLGSIGDTVFRDNNGNGIQDGEPGVPNVTVQLKDCSGNVLQSTTTNSNGNYSFGNLSAGCYTIGVPLPDGFAYSPQDQGGNDDTDSDVNPGAGMTSNINLGAGQNLTNVDAGLVPQGGGDTCIGDRTWRDTNANGIQDSNEPGLDGIEIYLGTDTNNDGAIDRYFGSTVSANGGQYQFCGLDPAITYSVEFVSPGTCGFTLPNVGNDDTIDSDPDLNKGIANGVVVVSGLSNNTIDAGFVCYD